MRKLLIPLFFVFAIPTNAYALGVKDKPLTYNQIAKKCTGKKSNWVKYNKIGFPQSAKNYLRVCIDEEVEKVRKAKLTKCLEKNKKNICLASFKLD
ncbi:MAG: hypothetical protein JJ840_00690 [Prochlorococcus marinus CUG1431]|uniref:Uncharacterized protein n=1 Tax=Prochlorococcus marinus CUG1433 TaxID=2774506 RepID=A0A9D9BSE8_PROMR|nr:hypothetical protein [Prochlorococcus marinus CUG1433]MBO6979865.1 hypothetical protein [Prochlorococcus marinus CUG1431]